MKKKDISDEFFAAEKVRGLEELIEIEKKGLWLDRRTLGDASETGLIKFCQPIEDLVEWREKYPVHQFIDEKGEPTVC